jgi:hypothetical protein
MTNSRTRVHFLVLFGLALAACHHRARDPVVAGGGQAASDRQIRNMVGLAARDMPCDARSLQTQQIGESLYSVAGCGRTREYLLQCTSRRACRWTAVTPVEQVAAAETQCTAFAISSPSPITRALTGCGQTFTYMIGCNVAACAWGHAADAGGTVVATAPASAPVQAAPPPAPVQGDPQGQLMTIASDRWSRAQACLDGQHVDATLTLGLDGRVTVQLDDPLHGSPQEACVQQVVADVTVQVANLPSPVTVMLTL